MFSQLVITILFVYTFNYILTQDDFENNLNVVKACRERERLVAKNISEFYKLVEVPLGFQLRLQCRYCLEKDDDQPKIWHKIENFNDSTVSEVHLDMKNDLSLNRIKLNAQHTLIINNITLNDSGQYLCRGLDAELLDSKFNYLVDIVFETEVTPESGNMTAWKTYNAEILTPLNSKFSSSEGTDFTYLRNKLKLEVEVFTDWDDFGTCELCGRPKGSGVKKRYGHCRLKTVQNANITSSNSSEIFLLNASEIPCRSLILNRVVEGICNSTRIIPDFILTEHCEGTCNPDADGVYHGWKSTKKFGFKYRKTFVLAENSHITLVCPESTLENRVIWRRNGRILKTTPIVAASSSQLVTEPRITIDTFNTLYLYDVTSSEEGNYTCTVDDVRMQQVVVFVVSKSKLLTQAFVRHMMYLAFILSLTLSCYCAGLVVTWTKRHTFKTYEELQALRPKEELEDDFV